MTTDNPIWGQTETEEWEVVVMLRRRVVGNRYKSRFKKFVDQRYFFSTNMVAAFQAEQVAIDAIKDLTGKLEVV